MIRRKVRHLSLAALVVAVCAALFAFMAPAQADVASAESPTTSSSSIALIEPGDGGACGVNANKYMPNQARERAKFQTYFYGDCYGKFLKVRMRAKSYTVTDSGKVKFARHWRSIDIKRLRKGDARNFFSYRVPCNGNVYVDMYILLKDGWAFNSGTKGTRRC